MKAVCVVCGEGGDMWGKTKKKITPPLSMKKKSFQRRWCHDTWTSISQTPRGRGGWRGLHPTIGPPRALVAVFATSVSTHCLQHAHTTQRHEFADHAGAQRGNRPELLTHRPAAQTLSAEPQEHPHHIFSWLRPPNPDSRTRQYHGNRVLEQAWYCGGGLTLFMNARITYR